MHEILSSPVDGSGFNPDYGILGSNLATDDSVKLFPRDCDKFVERVQELVREKTGRNIEVMVYGDGAFKDPVGKIWELADPVVSPAYTSGLVGTPNELKLKYLADNAIGDLKGEEAKRAIQDMIKAKPASLFASQASQGTTPAVSPTFSALSPTSPQAQVTKAPPSCIYRIISPTTPTERRYSA